MNNQSNLQVPKINELQLSHLSAFQNIAQPSTLYPVRRCHLQTFDLEFCQKELGHIDIKEKNYNLVTTSISRFLHNIQNIKIHVHLLTRLHNYHPKVQNHIEIP